jgi:hypothetical protein
MWRATLCFGFTIFEKMAGFGPFLDGTSSIALEGFRQRFLSN